MISRFTALCLIVASFALGVLVAGPNPATNANPSTPDPVQPGRVQFEIGGK